MINRRHVQDFKHFKYENFAHLIIDLNTQRLGSGIIKNDPYQQHKANNFDECRLREYIHYKWGSG